ncbi:TatD family hydrolase [Mesoterricola silvestris]|uniref:Deoxyribonuclease n=1 Tax=Mesoterricola silvestris TaxID=2927979 RepID=A0AA48KCB2_9BACT|nr:TatD family hydrolase [Mesoterricola silvestris]BDU73313.1 deoxyribonuclease [Mesoterricola silvestris]
MLFDAHCHLQDARFGAVLEGVLRRAAEAGVTRMVCCGTREEDWDRVLELGRRPEIIPMAGLHPWYVDSASPTWAARLEAAFDAGAGAGECGLDFSDGRPPRAAQEAALRVQLDLALRRDLPVSLHCVKAAGRLLQILQETGLPAAGGLVHAFSGAPEVALSFQALGLHLSFGRALTFPGATRARASFEALREDRILFETDSPDLPPCGVEGPNEPAHLARVAAAAPRRVPAFENASRLFRRWLP